MVCQLVPVSINPLVHIVIHCISRRRPRITPCAVSRVFNVVLITTVHPVLFPVGVDRIIVVINIMIGSMVHCVDSIDCVATLQHSEFIINIITQLYVVSIRCWSRDWAARGSYYARCWWMYNMLVGVIDVVFGACCVKYVPLHGFGWGFLLMTLFGSIRGIRYPCGSVICRFLVVPRVGGRHGWSSQEEPLAQKSLEFANLYAGIVLVLPVCRIFRRTYHLTV